VTDAFSLHQSARYSNSSYDRNQIQNRGFLEKDPANGVEKDFEIIARRARQGAQESDRFAIDTRAEYKFEVASTKHDLIAGVDYTKAFFRTRMSQGNIADLNILDPVYGAPVSTPDPLFNDL
jgi:iron complex outermembrane recepter protein